MTEPNPTNAKGQGRDEPVRGPKRLAISAVIVACLGLQISVFLPGIDRVLPHFPYYPFLKYNMYADAHTGVPTTTKSRIEATLADETVVPCMPADVKLQFFVWRYHRVEAMKSAEHTDGVAVEPYDAPPEGLTKAQRKHPANAERFNDEAWNDAHDIAERAAAAHDQPVTEVRIITTTFRLPDEGLEETKQTITFMFGETGVSP